MPERAPAFLLRAQLALTRLGLGQRRLVDLSVGYTNLFFE
jgi:hypothetical protein